MTIAYWSVLVVMLLPLLAATLAKKLSGFKAQDNADPRGHLAKAKGAAYRANCAQTNSFEIAPFFAAVVIIAHLQQANQISLDYLAVAFVMSRLVYLACYIANLALWRSLVFTIGMIIILCIFALGI